MKYILIFITLFLFLIASSLRAEDIKYGIYQSSSCHWMGCTTLEIKKETLRETHKSDKITDNSDTTEDYIVEDNFIKTSKSKTKYYYFTHPKSDTKKCGSYLAPEDLYKICDSKKECMLQKSFCFVATDYTDLEKINMDAYIAEFAKTANRTKASIIISTCPKNVGDAIKNKSIKVYVWVQANGLARDIKIAKSTGSNEMDSRIIQDLMRCQYSPAKEPNGKKVDNWIKL